MKTTSKPKCTARVAKVSTRTARKAASAPRAKKHHVLANAATQKTIVNNRSTARSAPKRGLAAFNPALPVDGSLIIAGELRNQFNGLKSLIDVIQSINAAQVDGVTTVNPGDPANASVSVIGETLHFTFAIPRGDEGVQGVPGEQGPPFANAIVDSVTTLSPGSPATVSISFDGTNVHFAFGIPAGQQGIPGADGPPGEVTNASLAAAISGTSNNTNAVSTLGLIVSDPPTQAEMQSLANKVDELILALRR